MEAVSEQKIELGLNLPTTERERYRIPYCDHKVPRLAGSLNMVFLMKILAYGET